MLFRSCAMPLPTAWTASCSARAHGVGGPPRASCESDSPTTTTTHQRVGPGPACTPPSQAIDDRASVSTTQPRVGTTAYAAARRVRPRTQPGVASVATYDRRVSRYVVYGAGAIG